MSRVTAQEILEGIHERFQLVEGLKSIIAYEPTSIHDTPMIYSLYRNYERAERGQVLAETHTYQHRLAISFADPESAEAELLKIAVEIPASVEADPQLDGRLASGSVSVSAGSAGFIFVNGSVYRVLDFTSTAIVKRSVTRGVY